MISSLCELYEMHLIDNTQENLKETLHLFQKILAL